MWGLSDESTRVKVRVSTAAQLSDVVNCENQPQFSGALHVTSVWQKEAISMDGLE